MLLHSTTKDLFRLLDLESLVVCTLCSSCVDEGRKARGARLCDDQVHSISLAWDEALAKCRCASGRDLRRHPAGRCLLWRKGVRLGFVSIRRCPQSMTEDNWVEAKLGRTLKAILCYTYMKRRTPRNTPSVVVECASMPFSHFISLDLDPAFSSELASSRSAFNSRISDSSQGCK